MLNKITIADARKQFTDIINRIAYNDESFVLTKRGEPIAALVPMKELKLLQEFWEQNDIKDSKKNKNEPNEPDEPIPWGDLIKDLGF